MRVLLSAVGLLLLMLGGCIPVYELQRVVEEETSSDAGGATFPYKPLPKPSTPPTHGVIAYARAEGGAFLILPEQEATPMDLDPPLDRISAGDDLAATISPSGRWLGLLSKRFGSEWAAAVLATRDLTYAEPIIVDHEMLHPSAPFAVGSEGDLVVFADTAGPHEQDLFVTHRTDSGWTHPELLTGDSTHANNSIPNIAADNKTVLFDCGPLPYGDLGTNICQVNTDGSGYRIVLSSTSPLFRAEVKALHHADFAPDGSIIFECNTAEYGERLWRLRPSETVPERIAEFENDNSPCILPDGRLASLYLSREGNEGNHEIKVMNSDGSKDFMVLINVNVLDTNLACGK